MTDTKQSGPTPADDGVWQPIETAPRDGTPLLLFARCKHATAKVRVIGWWIPDMGWVEECFSPNHPVGLAGVDHWMPLPPFPISPGAT